MVESATPRSLAKRRDEDLQFLPQSIAFHLEGCIVLAQLDIFRDLLDFALRRSETGERSLLRMDVSWAISTGVYIAMMELLT